MLPFYRWRNEGPGKLATSHPMSHGFSFPVCFQLDYNSNGSAKHPFLVNHTISINSCPTKAAEVPYTLKLHQILKLAMKPEISKLSNLPFCLILPQNFLFQLHWPGLGSRCPQVAHLGWRKMQGRKRYK